MGRKFTATALLLALILMLTLACSGADSTPAPETDRTQQELLRTIERMSEEVDALQREIEGSKRTSETEEPNATNAQTTQTPGIPLTPAPTTERQ